MKRMLPGLHIRFLALCLLLTLALPLFHQGTVLAMAVSLKAAAASHAIKNFLIWAGLDPVYASVFNRTLGNIEAQGLVIAAPLGDFFHRLAPGLFAPPDKVIPGAWATALVGDGVSVLASAAARVGTNAVFMAAGLVLLVLCFRHRRSRARLPFLSLVFLSAALQARGFVGLLARTFSPEDLEIMGLSHIFTKLFPLDAAAYGELVSGPFYSFAPYLIPSLVILAIYGAAAATLFFRTKWPQRQSGALSLIVRQLLRSPQLLAGNRLGYQSLAAIALLAAAATSPVFLPSRADYNFPLEEAGAYPEIAEDSPGLIPQGAMLNEAPSQGPSKVVVSGTDNGYSYAVNGRPVRIQGMGYNTMYSHLPVKERAARYDWDFAEMRAAGVNTILGWEREQFDELTLQKAQEYGLGVVLPYHMQGNGDYGNPGYEQRVEQDVKEWVKRFKNHPALRMWGIGNEVIHYINNPEAPRAKAYARFYVKLAGAVRSVDPDHPVLYRDAEDLYLGPFRDALRNDGGARPRFVYGTNFFTSRMCEVLSDWRKKGLDLPLLVSEFAPSGLSPEDRPKGYLRMWRCIAKEYPSVLGGFPYVWTTNGPEAIDRTMGLMDAGGQPVDRSFWSLGRAFLRRGAGANESLSTPP